MSRIASGRWPACSPARSRLTATAEKASGWRAAAPDSSPRSTSVISVSMTCCRRGSAPASRSAARLSKGYAGGEELFEVEAEGDELAARNTPASRQLACTPLNTNATNITTNSSLISWNSAPYAVTYQLDYKKQSDTTWANINAINDTSITIANLDYNTTYNYRVKTNCATYSSSFSIINNFTTLTPVCQPPVNLNATNILTTSGSVSWSTVQDAINYKLIYKIFKRICMGYNCNKRYKFLKPIHFCHHQLITGK